MYKSQLHGRSNFPGRCRRHKTQSRQYLWHKFWIINVNFPCSQIRYETLLKFFMSAGQHNFFPRTDSVLDIDHFRSMITLLSEDQRVDKM